MYRFVLKHLLTNVETFEVTFIDVNRWSSLDCDLLPNWVKFHFPVKVLFILLREAQRYCLRCSSGVSAWTFAVSSLHQWPYAQWAYINNLCRLWSTLFADDTNIFEKKVNGNQDTLTETGSKVDNWMKSNKLKCNLDKLRAIIFNKSSESNLHLGSLAIKNRHSLKYLEVIVDGSLCFKDHIAKIKQKLNFSHHT